MPGQSGRARSRTPGKDQRSRRMGHRRPFRPRRRVVARDRGRIDRDGSRPVRSLARGTRAQLAGEGGVVRRRPRIARRGGGGNAGRASGKARDRRPRDTFRGGFGSKPLSARCDGRADGVSFVPGARQLQQRPLPRPAVTAPAAAGEDRRRVLDVDGAGG